MTCSTRSCSSSRADRRRAAQRRWPWTGFGVDPIDGQPITVNEWIDRLAPKAAALVAVGTCATYGGVSAMKNNPTGAMGLPDFLGWGWRSRLDVPIVCIPGCPAQPDNMTSVLLELVLFAGGMGPAPTSTTGCARNDCSRARRARAEPRGLHRAGTVRHDVRQRPALPRQARLQGTGGRLQRAAARLVNGIGGCPNAGGICIGCTMPGFPDKFMPFMEPDPWGNAAANFQRFTYWPAVSPFSQAQPRAEVRAGAGVARPHRRSADRRARVAVAMITIGEFLRWILYRTRSLYFEFLAGSCAATGCCGGRSASSAPCWRRRPTRW